MLVFLILYGVIKGATVKGEHCKKHPDSEGCKHCLIEHGSVQEGGW